MRSLMTTWNYMREGSLKELWKFAKGDEDGDIWSDDTVLTWE